ncbi:unnamed protein product [Didymodactylos carnosus]|uniref:Mitochondrial ribosomal protein L32 n=1 Tax=Didymodactylos carnosus TaxID=1234261 RepID=A0A813PY89_9BILA|nr:unnamed protein product [Didymodactylos carnosus]CAF3537940.1 unnamed protein product [Didymodactylos carnosus]
MLNVLLSKSIAHIRLFTEDLTRLAVYLIQQHSFPPSSTHVYDILPSNSTSLTTRTPLTLQDILPDMSILLTQKKRATIERRRIRRHSDLPMNLMVRLGTPRNDLTQCLDCGSWHEKKTICGQCYDRIRKETESMKQNLNQDEFKYNHPQQEIVYLYKGEEEQRQYHEGKRIIEIPRERPQWFSKSLIPRINTTK